MRKPVAILSTTVLPIDGAYVVVSSSPDMPLVEGVQVSPAIAIGIFPVEAFPGAFPVEVSFRGVPHYIGHSDTKALVESLGAIPSSTKLFPGLKIGESALCVSIIQGKSTRISLGHTEPHQEVNWDDLVVRIIQRVA